MLFSDILTATHLVRYSDCDIPALDNDDIQNGSKHANDGSHPKDISKIPFSHDSLEQNYSQISRNSANDVRPGRIKGIRKVRAIVEARIVRLRDTQHGERNEVSHVLSWTTSRQHRVNIPCSNSPLLHRSGHTVHLGETCTNLLLPGCGADRKRP